MESFNVFNKDINHLNTPLGGNKIICRKPLCGIRIKSLLRKGIGYNRRNKTRYENEIIGL